MLQRLRYDKEKKKVWGVKHLQINFKKENFAFDIGISLDDLSVNKVLHSTAGQGVSGATMAPCQQSHVNFVKEITP